MNQNLKSSVSPYFIWYCEPYNLIPGWNCSSDCVLRTLKAQDFIILLFFHFLLKMKLHNLKEAIFSYCHFSDLRITTWHPLSSIIQEWQEQTKIASEVQWVSVKCQNTEKINSHCVEIKQAFSACLAVSPFLVVPIPYDSELNSLSLPTVQVTEEPLFDISWQCEITLS